MKNISALFSTFMIYAILVAMTVSPVFALGEGARNLFLIGIMGLSPIVVIMYPYLYEKDIALILIGILIVMSPLLFNSYTMRWSTVMYALMFLLTFMAYNRILIDEILNIDKYKKLLIILIYAYAITLLIQQFCVLTGLPIFNVSEENYFLSDPWKLNSLTSEPSHSVRYMALIMFSFISIRETIKGTKYSLVENMKEDKWIWAAFLWTMLTSISATAYIFLLIIMLKFVNWKNILIIGFVVVCIFFIGKQSGNEAFNRAYKTGVATLTLDEKKIIKADHSGSARIVPMILCAKMIHLNEKEGWFGHGVDYVSRVMYKIFPGVKKGYTSGGIFLVGVEYGILVFIIFIIFSFRTTFRKEDITTLFFWLFMCINEGINVQITWAAIIFLYTNKILIQRQISKNEILKNKEI